MRLTRFKIGAHTIDLRIWRRIRRSDAIGFIGAIAILLWAVGVVRKWW